MAEDDTALRGHLDDTRHSFYKMVRERGISDPEAIAASESWRPTD